jgi:hypothetical protein
MFGDPVRQKRAQIVLFGMGGPGTVRAAKHFILWTG